jgi:hypothetical protein
VDASWESQTYRGGPRDTIEPPFDESRVHGALTFSNWLAANLRYSATAGVDSWSGASQEERTIFVGASLERRWLDDRWSVGGSGTTWMAAPKGSAFHQAGLRAAFRSSRSTERWVYLADAGVERASNDAPLAVWPGAGEGRAREPLMRAHPLLDGGAIDLSERSVFGKTLIDARAEAQRWIAAASPVRFGLAAFADAGRASRRLTASPNTVTQVDVGGGLRVRIPGADGVLRVDIAHGVKDGADALTVGWQF